MVKSHRDLVTNHDSPITNHGPLTLTFLGTNGWYDTETGSGISTLLESSSCYIVFDAGNGIYKLDRYVKEEKPVYLLISHLHLDHVCGLHILNKFSFPKGLNICVNAQDRGSLEALVNEPYTIPLEQLPYEARVISIPGEVEAVPFSLDWRYLRHSVPTLGFRVRIDDKVIVYCPDTGYCEEAVELAKGADLLLAECAYLPGETYEHWPHLNPESAAKLALKAGVKRLALTHFDASRYLDMKDRARAEKVAKALFPNTLAARDDLVLEI